MALSKKPTCEGMIKLFFARDYKYILLPIVSVVVCVFCIVILAVALVRLALNLRADRSTRKAGGKYVYKKETSRQNVWLG